ncbi:MAG: hypothetical protein AAGF95_01310 [Chloroflexota bacterium]
MGHDLRLLARLRLHQFRGSVTYWLGTVGYDLDDRSLMNLLYGVYLVIALCGWVLLMWAWWVFEFIGIGATLTPELHAQLLTWMPRVVLLGLVLVSMRALRSSPLKLTTPDTAYIAGSPFLSAAVALVGFVWSSFPVLAISVFAATLIGNAMAQLVGPTATANIDWRMIVIGLLLGWLIWIVAWVLGLLRLAFTRLYETRLIAFAPLLLLLPIPIIADILNWPGQVLVAAIFNEGWLWQAGGLLLLSSLLVAILVIVAQRVSLTDVNDESVLYAQLKSLGLMVFVDPSVAQRLRRQAQQAQRRPRPPLPRVSGYATFVARAVVSFARQPGVLIRSLVWSVGITQFGAWLIVQNAGVFALSSWLLVILLFPPRGLLYVFQLNAEEPFLRRLLPVNPLMLLLADIALPLFLVALSSVVVWSIFDVTLLTALFGGLLAFSISAVLMFSLGAVLAGVRVASVRMPYEGLALGGVGSIILMSFLSNSPIIPAIHAVLLVGLLGQLIADDSEALAID